MSRFGLSVLVASVRCGPPTAPPRARLDSTRNRLILVSGCLGVATMLLGGTAIIRRVVPRVLTTTQIASTTARPDHHGGTDDHGRHDHHPGTDHHGGTDDGARAPTTTAPSPAIVPVAAPEYPFVSVGSSGGGETAGIQQRLVDLGFWNTGADGEYGLTTSQA